MRIHTLRREQRLPGAVMGAGARIRHAPAVRCDLERIFDHRAEHVPQLLGAARR